jgi:aromatic ring-opening dioxygenase LigB subunit
VLVAGCLVPHAPLLLPQLASPEVQDAALLIRKAILDLEVEEDATVVLISPHGTDARVCNGADGTLDGFGVEDITVTAPVDTDLVAQLADEWIWPSSSEEIDHGITVPLALGAAKINRVVPVALPETTGPDATPLAKALEEARALVGALEKASRSKKIAVIASVNTSAGLSSRGPLTELPGAAEIETRVLAALERDVAEIEGVVEKLHSTGGSCAAGPLLCLALLFGGHPAPLLAYEKPVGVGYPVAQVVL